MLFHQNKIYSSRDVSTKKRRNLIYTIIAIIVIVIVFVGPVRRGVSKTLAYIGKPAWILREKFYSKFPEQATLFTTKKRLERENSELRDALRKADLVIAENEFLVEENKLLQSQLDKRPVTQVRIQSTILSRVSDSPFDTLIIDIGKESGVSVGDLVYAEGRIALGRIQEVDISTSKVVLFSADNIRTNVLVGSNQYFLESIGEGGQNISIEFPADIKVNEGDLVILDDQLGSIVAKISVIDSTPGGLISVALGRSLANLAEIKFVEVSLSGN